MTYLPSRPANGELLIVSYSRGAVLALLWLLVAMVAMGYARGHHAQPENA